MKKHKLFYYLKELNILKGSNLLGCLLIAFFISILFSLPLLAEQEFKGFNYTAWNDKAYGSENAENSAIRMEKTGSNTYTIIVSEYMKDFKSDEIYSRDKKTPTEESLAILIRKIKARGGKVILKPHLDFESAEFRGHFKPSDPDKWFPKYRKMLDKYALLSEKENVDVFCVGTELKGTTEYEDQWRKTISGVRSKYNGKLVYASDWTNYDKVKFWDALDYAGIDAYFPISDKRDPSFGELLDGWDKSKKKIDSWQKTHGKPLIFTEIGYRNSNNAAKEPWAWGDSPQRNDKLQKMLFDATAVTWEGTPYLAGTQWWDWGSDLSKTGDIAFNPIGKPAEASLNGWFSGSTSREIAAIAAAHRNIKKVKESGNGFFGIFTKIFGNYDKDVAEAEKALEQAYAQYNQKLDIINRQLVSPQKDQLMSARSEEQQMGNQLVNDVERPAKKVADSPVYFRLLEDCRALEKCYFQALEQGRPEALELSIKLKAAREKLNSWNMEK